jgi:hypothetical protein
MRKLVNFSLVVLLAAVAMACSGDLEKRVSDLERRVADLERGGAATAAPLTASNRPAAEVAEPVEKPDGPLPAITFVEKEHDFGRLKAGDVVTKVFKFTNTGDAPLIISNATSSCGCTVPDYPKDTPIAPGESGEMKVQFNSRGTSGQQNKVVRITANTWPQTTTLTVKSFVEKADEGAETGPLKN